MPISRYDIRNEYSLADPELYRAADKDDPEALLEGVAMAGLVGVLRQLGDLAEFAAEIFHDLHEEVMATAARGHGLMIRVQQLEAEVPSIEKAFLSQTDHSSFFYNSGADWRSNLRMDHNVVTKGDLPRFVMDSYEECRGPPRLFLLDKFDVAGAGACLKRYTDPSFCKVESSAMANADAQREKKFRKAKKKVPRGRYGETPELLPASHAKLHHVFLEEPDDKGVSKPAHRAKLKKRMNGFPFDSKTGKSYMEKLLKTPSPEHKMLHEITASPPLWMDTNDHHESDLDILELRSVSPAREIDGRKISSPPPDRKETLNPIMNQTNDGPTDIEICEVPSYLNLVTDGIPATFDEEHGEKDIIVYEESKAEGSSIGYQSDDIASEIDNYMDAPSTIESEMDTDSEMRVKKNSTSSYVKSRSPVSVENDEHLQSQSSDSQSTGDLTISNEKSISCKKEVSSLLSSASSRTSAENPQSKDLSAEEFPSADVPEIDSVNTSAYQKATDNDFPAEGLPEPVVSNHTFLGKDALRNKGIDFEQHSSNFCSSTLIPILPHCDSGVVRKGRLMGSKSEKTASTSDDEGKKTNLIIDTPCSHSVSHSKSLSGDDSPRSSGEHLVAGEDAPFMSNIADTIDHISHSPAAISAYLLHEDDNDVEDNQFENVTFTSNMGNVCSQNNIDTEEIISSDSATQCKLSDEAAILPDHFSSDSTHIARGGDDNTSKVPEVKQQNGNLYNEDSIVVSDAPNPLSCVMEAAIGMKFREIPWTNAKTVTSEDHYASSVIVNQISSETLILSGTEDSFGLQGAGLDAHDRDLIPEEAKRVNEIPELGTPKSFVVVGLQGTNDVTPNDLEDPAGISYTAEKDGFHPDSGITALETTENSRASDLELLSEVHVQLDKSDSETDQLETAPIACSVLPVSDKTSREIVNLPAGLDILVEEHIPCFEDSGLVEHGIDKTRLSGSNREMELVAENRNYLSGSHEQSGLMDEVDERDDAPLEHHREVRNYVLDTDREYFLGNGVNDQGADANSSPIDCAAEEPILQEKIELPPDRIDQELPDSQLLINHQKMIDQDSDEGHNNFALSSALVSCSPSVSGISGLSDYVSDASACPMDPPGFIFPPRNLLSETNQINLDGLPPLPPLPPLQWRTGKLQDTPSTTQEEMVDHKKISPQEIPSPAASTGNSTSSLELMNNHSIQIVPQIPLKEENVEVSSTSSEGNSKHDTVDLRPKIENERHQFMILTQNLELSNDPEIQVSPQISFKEENVEESTTSLDTNSKHETVDLPPTIENERHQFMILTQNLELSNDPEIRVSPQISLKEENVEQSTTSLDTNSKHETVDLPPTIENEKHQLMMPTQKNNEAASPAEEDRVASGKLPRSCNPLIGSAAALDKSKLRKVTERERPQIQKPDERDSLLEQIRAKSFNLKPAVASRPSIRGPKTNLKVAAILEKANAIRQALAGSDEDDDDNWSDS